MSPLVLRPALRGRVIYLVGTWCLCAFCLAGVFYTPFIGAAGVLFFGFGGVNAAFRLWQPRSYTTELGDEGFRVYDSLGRLVHDVRWAEIAYLTVVHANTFRGPGTALVVAWRCEPRRRGPGHQPWSHGGRNRVGDEFDGALPDVYLGIDRMLALFKQRVDAAHAGRPVSEPARDVRLEAF